VLFGLLVSPAITLTDYAGFLVLATLGNAFGGAVFVALLKYGHVVRGAGEHDDAAGEHERSVRRRPTVVDS